eukprot:Sspe_Gene.50568::Locus_28141_Transcript_3_3_Confidence_0.500_Length_2094::g.50568::m.50568
MREPSSSEKSLRYSWGTSMMASPVRGSTRMSAYAPAGADCWEATGRRAPAVLAEEGCNMESGASMAPVLSPPPLLDGGRCGATPQNITSIIKCAGCSDRLLLMGRCWSRARGKVVPELLQVLRGNGDVVRVLSEILVVRGGEEVVDHIVRVVKLVQNGCCLDQLGGGEEVRAVEVLHVHGVAPKLL